MKLFNFKLLIFILNIFILGTTVLLDGSGLITRALAFSVIYIIPGFEYGAGTAILGFLMYGFFILLIPIIYFLFAMNKIHTVLACILYLSIVTWGFYNYAQDPFFYHPIW